MSTGRVRRQAAVKAVIVVDSNSESEDEEEDMKPVIKRKKVESEADSDFELEEPKAKVPAKRRAPAKPRAPAVKKAKASPKPKVVKVPKEKVVKVPKEKVVKVAKPRAPRKKAVKEEEDEPSPSTSFEEKENKVDNVQSSSSHNAATDNRFNFNDVPTGPSNNFGGNRPGNQFNFNHTNRFDSGGQSNGPGNQFNYNNPQTGPPNNFSGNRFDSGPGNQFNFNQAQTGPTNRFDSGHSNGPGSQFNFNNPGNRFDSGPNGGNRFNFNNVQSSGPNNNYAGNRFDNGQSSGGNRLNSDNKKNARFPWQEYELLSELQNIDHRTAKTVIHLFQEDNTIPFICRYRKELIGDMSPDCLRDIKLAYNQVLGVKAKAETIIKSLEKEEKMTNEIRRDLLCAKSIDELEHLFAPFKPANKGSLADRAKALGLELHAEEILIGNHLEVPIPELVKPDIEGLETQEKVEEGIKHIMAHNLSKNTLVLEEIRRLQYQYDIILTSSQIKTKAPSKKKEDAQAAPPKKHTKKVDEFKFEHYFEFTCATRYLRPHQIMALNRGENLKVLSIKLTFKDNVKNDLNHFLRKQYMNYGEYTQKRMELFEASFEEAFTKKLLPLMSRQIRSELTKKAEKASVEVFANNLKQLLLTAPVKGEKILGIDPGFSNGCKLALISECGDVLDTSVIYPHTGGERSQAASMVLVNMMRKHNCKLIALGNGTACRESETFLSYLFEEHLLDNRQVRYSIVPEQGASIYSCGEVAKKEFPNLDVNLISAASIARRLQDPMCEYVKIEPRNLGVGMYQHDINEKTLSESLDEVVMECVSFVGVDINTASVSLLSHVAGLTAKRAEHIVQHRMKNGPFKSRDELIKVKFIGDKTFTQCAGFVRIEPLTAGLNDYNLLDSTWVHPESYDIAETLIKKLNLSNKDIGNPRFIYQIRNYAQSTPIDKISEIFKQPAERIQSVISALQRELLRDYRADINKQPLFKKGLTSMADLVNGTILTGAVNNVTDFGCFVDIGVESNGLIHRSKMNGQRLNIGDRVEVSVLNVDQAKSRIQLKLENIL